MKEKRKWEKEKEQKMDRWMDKGGKKSEGVPRPDAGQFLL